MQQLSHHGVLGMKWGVRRERRAAEKAEKKDLKWVRKQGSKIADKAKKNVSKEMASYVKNELVGQMRLKSGKISLTAANQYNQRLAELMNQQVKNIAAPSGKELRFIAKRGEIGVHTALADQGYNMDLVKRGVNAEGRVAYKKEVLKKG